MKLKINIQTHRFTLLVCLVSCMLLLQLNLTAQDSTVAAAQTQAAPAKAKPVKNTFQSVWIMDNQTVLVPVKGTFEMDIMHRFGKINTGYDKLWGLFAEANIRLGVSYSPLNKLSLGIGLTNKNMLWDASAKYSIITQTKDKYPVSVTYYTNLAYNSQKNANINGVDIKYASQRFSFFHQLIIARKVTDRLSIQVAPSLSHQNSVEGYIVDSAGIKSTSNNYLTQLNDSVTIFKKMNHNHFAISFSGRYKITNVTSIMVNYDQPLTTHALNNPSPNLSFGVEFNTSSHSFQLFVGNYSMMNQQQNNLYNTNAPFDYTAKDGTKVKGGQFLIGFNITRLWNY